MHELLKKMLEKVFFFVIQEGNQDEKRFEVSKDIADIMSKAVAPKFFRVASPFDIPRSLEI